VGSPHTRAAGRVVRVDTRPAGARQRRRGCPRDQRGADEEVRRRRPFTGAGRRSWSTGGGPSWSRSPGGQHSGDAGHVPPDVAMVFPARCGDRRVVTDAVPRSSPRSCPSPCSISSSCRHASPRHLRYRVRAHVHGDASDRTADPAADAADPGAGGDGARAGATDGRAVRHESRAHGRAEPAEMSPWWSATWAGTSVPTWKLLLPGADGLLQSPTGHGAGDKELSVAEELRNGSRRCRHGHAPAAGLLPPAVTSTRTLGWWRLRATFRTSRTRRSGACSERSRDRRRSPWSGPSRRAGAAHARRDRGERLRTHC